MTTPKLAAPMIDPRSELADVLDSILRDLGQVVHSDQVCILLLPSVLDMQQDPSGTLDEEATLLITVRESGVPGTLQGSLDPVPLGRYPLNRLLMISQKPVVIPDTRTNAVWVPLPAPTQEIRSWIGAPLVVKGESIGVLTAHSLAPNVYTEREGIIVFAFASQAIRVRYGEALFPVEGESHQAFSLRMQQAIAELFDEDRTSWWEARRRAAADETPNLTGPAGPAWLRTWEGSKPIRRHAKRPTWR